MKTDHNQAATAFDIKVALQPEVNKDAVVLKSATSFAVGSKGIFCLGLALVSVCVAL